MDEHKDESNPDKTLVRVKVFNSGNPNDQKTILTKYGLNSIRSIKPAQENMVEAE